MEKTWFEKRLAQRLKDPKFAGAYHEAKAEIDAVDALVRELDAERSRQGLSKAALAKLSGLPPESVRRLFTVEDPDPKLSNLMPLAVALGRPIALSSPNEARPGSRRSRRGAGRGAVQASTRKPRQII